MHVVVNQRLVRDRVRRASVFHFSALGVFGVGLWLSLTYPDQILGSYAAIVMGLLLYNFGQSALRRWGPRFRQDAVLGKALSGLDNRYSFLAFPSAKLPDYILLGPSGIHVIVPRNHAGAVTCRGDRWTQESPGGVRRVFSMLGRTPLGDPGRDVARGIQQVRAHLQKRGISPEREPPIDGLVVFTNPSAKLRIDGCSCSITGLKHLRNSVRATKGSLSQQALNELRQALAS